MNTSIYIPVIFSGVDLAQIKKVFHDQRLGCVSKVDFIYGLGDFESWRRSAFVHLTWFTNVEAIALQTRMKNPDMEARVVYDDPWFWMILPNRSAIENPPEISVNTKLNFLQSAIHYLTDEIEDIKVHLKAKTNQYLPKGWEMVNSTGGICVTGTPRDAHDPESLEEIQPEWLDETGETHLNFNKLVMDTDKFSKNLNTHIRFKDERPLDETEDGEIIVDVETGNKAGWGQENQQWEHSYL